MSGTCACSETATGLMAEASLEGTVGVAEVIIMNAAKKIQMFIKQFYDDAQK